MKSVITMDQFANFLLKKQSVVDSREETESEQDVTYREKGEEIKD